ncbi:hypothetical protein DL93DRAFT_2163096 [Clavulina sp. PMI_390]|nr:hypothetical protein DL93DRAFT_2163096 [Clavulina sp. PMI_390]
MNRGPPYPQYQGPPQATPQQPPASNWGAYYAQPAPQPQAPAPQMPPQPAVSNTPDQAAMYANYGYGAGWRPPPTAPQPQVQPPQAMPQPQYMPMPPNGMYQQPAYPMGFHPTHPTMPMMYMPPNHPNAPPAHPSLQPMRMHQPTPPQVHPPPAPPQQASAPQFFPIQPQAQPQQQPQMTNNPNSQRFPPAKRPRFDRPPGQANPAPANSNNGPNQKPPPSGPSKHPEPPTVGPPPPSSQPPAPPSGPQFNSNQGSATQTHGRFPPQQPAFRGRGGGVPLSNKNRGVGRGSGGGRGDGRQGMGRGGSGRGSHGPSRGSFRSGGGQNAPYKPVSNAQPLTTGISASSFNPQLPNGQPLAAGLPSHRLSKHNHGSLRDMPSRREDSAMKKTLTDFRIIGISCPTLSWSWGNVPEDQSTEDADRTAISGAENQQSDPTSSQSSNASALSGVPDSSQESNASTVTARGAETSRIRLYFNSPIDLEDRLFGPPTLDQATSRRGGKRKKEDDDGEPEEGGKRKKEDNDSSLRGHHDAASMSNASPVRSSRNGATDGYKHESSRVGEKRKASSLSGDEESRDDAESHDHESATGTQPDAEVDETEYAGSPTRDTFPELVDPPSHFPSSAVAEGDIEISSQAPPDIAEHDHDVPPSEPDDSMSTSEVGAMLDGSAGEDVKPAQADPLPISDSGDANGDETPVAKVEPLEDESKPPQPPTPADPWGSPIKAPHSNVVLPSGSRPSPDRISISYAGSSRRLVLDAEIVKSVKILRAAGRVEVKFVLEPIADSSITTSPTAGLAAEAAMGPIIVPKSEAPSEPETSQADEQDVPSHATSDDSALDATPADAASEAIDAAVIEPTATQRISTSMETLSEITKEYVPATTTTDDALAPDFGSLLAPKMEDDSPVTVELVAYLDRLKPLSEPKWVRTGEVDDMLSSVFARNAQGRAVWEGKVDVADPDPPPTLASVLDTWITTSTAGSLEDRQRFAKEHVNSGDHILEIALRQVRHHGGAPISASGSIPSLSFPAGSASLSSFNNFSPNAPSSAQFAQAPVSLVMLGLWQLANEYAERAGEERPKLEERLGNLLVRCISQSNVFKSLDAMFREWGSTVGLTVPPPSNSTPRKK